MLADRIMELRKKKGWSQEELGECLGVSRQSVSKWETGLSQPDLDNILQMSEVFGVTTDYLLKDAPFPEDAVAEDVRRVDRSTALTYIDLVCSVAKRIALGVGLCVFAPIPLLLLAGGAEYHGLMTEDAAGGFGVALMLVIIALGVLLLVLNGLKLAPYEYLEKEAVVIDKETRSLVEELKTAYEPRFRAFVAVGIVLCILGVVPMMIAVAFHASDFGYVCMAAMLLLMVSVAVQFLIGGSMPKGAYQRLLQEGDYSKEEKATNQKLSWLPGVYWLSVTAIFLICGFLTEEWELVGYIWPVAGILFAVLWIIAKAVTASQKK